MPATNTPRALLAAALVLAGTGSASAFPRHLVRGQLTSAGGSAWTTPTTLEISLHSEETGGFLAFSEGPLALPDPDGSFGVEVGAVFEADDWGIQNGGWLEVEVQPDAPAPTETLAPRLAVRSGAQASRALRAEALQPVGDLSLGGFELRNFPVPSLPGDLVVLHAVEDVLGDLGSLATTATADLVAATNELAARRDDLIARTDALEAVLGIPAPEVHVEPPLDPTKGLANYLVLDLDDGSSSLQTDAACASGCHAAGDDLVIGATTDGGALDLVIYSTSHASYGGSGSAPPILVPCASGIDGVLEDHRAITSAFPAASADEFTEYASGFFGFADIESKRVFGVQTDQGEYALVEIAVISTGVQPDNLAYEVRWVTFPAASYSPFYDGSEDC